MGVYRSATGNRYNKYKGECQCLSDNDLLVQYGLISPLNILKLARILLFVRMISKNVMSLLTLVRPLAAMKNGWVAKWCAIFIR